MKQKLQMTKLKEELNSLKKFTPKYTLFASDVNTLNEEQRLEKYDEFITVYETQNQYID